MKTARLQRVQPQHKTFVDVVDAEIAARQSPSGSDALERLKALLDAKAAVLGWAQEDLAQHSGLHTKSVSYWKHHGERAVGRIAVRDMVSSFREHGLVFIDGGITLKVVESIADG